MMQKQILALIALLFTVQVFAETPGVEPAAAANSKAPVAEESLAKPADITPAMLGMAAPIFVMKNDFSKLSQFDLGKYLSEVVREGSTAGDLLSKALMTYEMLLPIEAKQKEKVILALDGDFESIGDMTTRQKYLGGCLIGTIEYPVSVEQIFNMMGLLPSISPEINEYITVTSITVNGFNGFNIKDNLGRNLNSDFLISHDGKTILFGAPSLIKKQFTTPETFPDVVLNAFKATESHAGSFIFVFPDGFKKDLKENYLDESSLDASIKDALNGGLALTISWEDDPVISTAYLMATLADEETATLLNTQLIEPWVLPTTQQFLPMLIGDGYGFPATMRAVQDGAFVGLAGDFNEEDIKNLAKLIKETITALKENASEKEELVVEFEGDDEEPPAEAKTNEAATEATTEAAPAEAEKPADAPKAE